MKMEPTIKEIKSKLDYRPGDIGKSGEKIEFVYRASRDVVIYETESGFVTAEYEENFPELIHLTIRYYHELGAKIPTDIDDHKFENLKRMLISSYFEALSSSTEKQVKEAFREIKKSIGNTKKRSEIKSVFILSSILVCACISSISFYYFNVSSNNFKEIFACISFGCIGSLFSVLQRNNDFEFDSNQESKYIILQSCFTSLFGAISGGILFIVCKSGIALTIANENIYALAVLSIIAGFSERMIPELFKKIESQNNHGKI